MAEGLNRVTLYGTLGQDAELKHTSNSSVVNMRIACNERFKAGNEWKEKVEWISLQWWGKRAEALHQYLVKGKSLLVEGSITTRSWEDKEGKKQYRTEVRVSNVILGGSSSKSNTQDESSDDDDDSQIPF